MEVAHICLLDGPVSKGFNEWINDGFQLNSNVLSLGC